MHNVSIRQHIVDRVVARRGDIHWFTELDPRKTALLIIDMQNTFCLPGAPGEVPTAREIVTPINELAAQLRPLGVPVFWVGPEYSTAPRHRNVRRVATVESALAGMLACAPPSATGEEQSK